VSARRKVYIWDVLKDIILVWDDQLREGREKGAAVPDANILIERSAGRVLSNGLSKSEWSPRSSRVVSGSSGVVFRDFEWSKDLTGRSGH